MINWVGDACLAINLPFEYTYPVTDQVNLLEHIHMHFTGHDCGKGM